jgi:hypothetical protein
LEKLKTKAIKKTLLLLILCVGTILGASAQCTPDTTHFTGTTYVYPSQLPCIYQHTAFAGVVSLKVPDSLDVNNFVSQIPSGYVQGHVDSIRIDSITGYPAGISSVSNPALGTTWLHHGQYACANFTGTTTAPAGSYPLTIYGSGCGHFTLPATFGGGTYDSCFQSFNFSRLYPYALQVCYPAGVTEVSEGMNLSVYPNPNQGSFTVSISATDRINGTLSIIDQLGRTINAQNIDVTGTKQLPLSLGNIAPGAYLLEINNNGSRSVKQFIVK